MTWMGAALLATAAAASPLSGQGAAGARSGYFGGVAEYFSLPAAEVAILGEWRLPDDEIPVVLFLARRGGVSPEAVVALRRSGRGWGELALRYGIGAGDLHVPLPEAAPAGVLGEAYAGFRSLPAGRWGEITLTDRDIVGLVNLRVLSQTLRRSPADVLARVGPGGWVEAHARLMGVSVPR